MDITTGLPQPCLFAPLSTGRDPNPYLLSWSPHSAKLSKYTYSITVTGVLQQEGHSTAQPVTASRKYVTPDKFWSPDSVEICRVNLYSTHFSFPNFSVLQYILKYILSKHRQHRQFFFFFFTAKGRCYFNNQFFPTCPNTLSQHCHYHNCSSTSEPMYRQCILTDLMVLTTKTTKVSPPTHPFAVQMSVFIVCKMTVEPMIMVWRISFEWQCLHNDFSPIHPAVSIKYSWHVAWITTHAVSWRPASIGKSLSSRS